jgi:hypothetical protein
MSDVAHVDVGNGSEGLFQKRLRLLVELAGVEHDLQKSHWQSGNITDAEYKRALDSYVATTLALKAQWEKWQEMQT